jgi:hypothetical protein
VNRHARDSEEIMINMSEMQVFEHNQKMMEHFVDISIFFLLKRKKGRKCKTMHKQEMLTNGAFLIVLSNKKVEDVTFFSDEDDDEMHIVIERDIQKFKDTWTMY